MEHIVVKGRIVFAGSLAVWRKGDFQKFRLHGHRVNHYIDAVYCSTFLVMHFRVLGCNCNENVPQHLFYLLIDQYPFHFVVFFKLLNEILVLYLLEVGNIAIVHNCELGLIG